MLLADHVVRRGNRLPLGAIAAFSVPLLPHFVFTYRFYGELLPDTLTAKIAQGRSGLWGESPLLFLDIRPVYIWLFDRRPLLPIMLLGLAGLGFVRGWRLAAPRLLALYVLLYTGTYAWLNVPFYPWYYATHLYALGLFAALGLAAVGGGRPAAGRHAAQGPRPTARGRLAVRRSSGAFARERPDAPDERTHRCLSGYRALARAEHAGRQPDRLCRDRNHRVVLQQADHRRHRPGEPAQRSVTGRA